jgi:DUF1680 family protein
MLASLAASALAAPMTPFPLSQVRIGDGIFNDSMDVNRRVIDEIGDERALFCFRFQAKLATGDTKPLEGWATPEPNGAFPGFYEGHYLSGLSLLAAQTGDAKLRERVGYMIAELAKCQQALGGKYLFASPEVEFEPKRLDGVAWYRMHKLMEGLLAAHRHAGNAQALMVLNSLADWIETRMKTYGDQFETVKKTEYGGMTEALENLYSLTHNPRHREMAHAWEQRELMLDRFHKHEDYCDHANTLLAKMVGAARIAEVENSEYHLTAAGNFWDLVAGSGRKTYATGGTSVHEGMPGVRALANSQSRMAQETCVSYNLLKVTRSLFHLTGELKYMDYYERSLFNAILGSQDAKTGWKTYYQPLNANTLKDFRSHLTGCYCCNGTGLENPAQYGSAIYTHNDAGLRVNLFIASALDWPEKGLRIQQATRFPEEAATTLTIQAKQPVTMEIGIRIPAWCAKGFHVAINGTAETIDAKPGNYAILTRTWKTGDRIECGMPMSFSKYPMPDKDTQMAFLYGPVVMVGEGARPRLGELVGNPDDPNNWNNKLDTWFIPAKEGKLHFSARDGAGRSIHFKPYYQVGGGEFFTGYWDIVKTSAIVDDHNIALGKPTQCSTPDPIGCNLESFMCSGKAVDGQYGGDDDWYVKWFPNGMAPQWITVDLERELEISGTEWFPAVEDVKANVGYRYKIESSPNNETWHIYDDHASNTTPAKSYPHQAAVSARYMRLTVFPPPDPKDNQVRPKIAEFKIFGQAVPPPGQ